MATVTVAVGGNICTLLSDPSQYNGRAFATRAGSDRYWSTNSSPIDLPLDTQEAMFADALRGAGMDAVAARNLASRTRFTQQSQDMGEAVAAAMLAFSL